MIQGLAKAVRARYNAGGANLKKTSCLLEQRATVQNLSTERTDDVLEGIDDEDGS